MNSIEDHHDHHHSSICSSTSSAGGSHDGDFSNHHLNNDDDDDDVPISIGSSSQPNMKNYRKVVPKIATAESQAVFRIRVMVLLFLIMSTIVTACLVYFSTRNGEQEQFEADFEDLAAKVLNNLGSSIEASLGAMDSFVVSIVSFAQYNNMTWPYVTIPNYGTQASKVRSVTKSILLVQIQSVLSDQRLQWDEYSLNVGPTWVDQNIAVQNADPTVSTTASGVKNIKNEDHDEYTVSGLWGYKPEATLHRPMWQSYPTVPLFGYSPFNLDLTLLPSLTAALPALNDRNAVVGYISNDPTTRTIDETSNHHQINSLIKEYVGNETEITEPLSELYYPIFEDAATHVLSKQNKTTEFEMVSILGSWFYWREFIKEILPRGNNGIIVVFENGCNQTFSYQINGPDVVFLGYLDAHQSKYKYYAIQSGLIDLIKNSYGAQSYTGLSLVDTSCPYTVRLYPSKTFEDQYLNSDPWYYMATTVAIFVFTTIVFISYDLLVEKRQKKILSSGKLKATTLTGVATSP